MTLLAGGRLDPKKFFEGGNPQVQGSSFDLTIGCIFDHEGKKVDGLFKIKPGHMVQVVSAEALILSDRHTAHVTYKTTMTRQGIWALTVGIVDPGWNGPIATTLLNFSRVDHAVAEGDAFLRISLFEHDSVPSDKLRKADPRDVYLKGIQKIAASRFPPTFLDTDDIAEAAGKHVLDRIRKEALVWVGGIALIFTLLQAVAGALTGSKASLADIELLKARVETLQTELLKVQADKVNAPGASSAKLPIESSPTPSQGSEPPPARVPRPAGSSAVPAVPVPAGPGREPPPASVRTPPD
jgi:deoxycytidine triphosphate deaminase